MFDKLEIRVGEIKTECIDNSLYTLKDILKPKWGIVCSNIPVVKSPSL